MTNIQILLSLYLMLFLWTVIECSKDIEATDQEDRVSPFTEQDIVNFCSPWWIYCGKAGNNTCRKVANNIIKCNSRKELTVLEYYCVTYDESEHSIEAGKCIYNSVITKSLGDMPDFPYTTLTRNISELNDVMCPKNLNRIGTLCGKCKDGLYPLAYSFDMNCVECPKSKSNWWKFVLAAFLPPTILYFLVLFFNINITSSQLQGFSFFSQSICMPAVVRLSLLNIRFERSEVQTLVRYLGVFYTPWNLDFFRLLKFSNVCLKTDMLLNLSLDLAVAVYPFVLMVVSYLLIQLYDNNFRPLVIIWKPFRTLLGLFHRNWEIRTSLIDAFATFFLLSNVKFLSASFDLLFPVQVHQINSTGHLTYSWRLYFDATTLYFGQKHLPYAILAIAVLLLFVLFPVLLLILYPFHWFQKLLNLFPVRWYVLHTFMDTFQGCYKDGTQPGSCDCRWFASVLYIARISLMLIGMFTQTSMYAVFSSIVLVMIVIITVIIQPFKSTLGRHSDTSVMFIFILAIYYTTYTVIVFQLSLVMTLVAVLPLLYVSVIILLWIYRYRTFGLEQIRRFCAWRHGYNKLN